MPHSGAQGAFRASADGPALYREERDLGVFGRTRIILGESSAWVEHATGWKQELHGEYRSRARLLHHAVWLVNWRGLLDSMVHSSEADLDGRPVRVLGLKGTGVPDHTLTVDAETGDVLRVERLVGSIGLPETVRFEDNRDVGGLRFPFKITQGHALIGEEVILIDSIQTQVEFKPGCFEIRE